jgi:anaerobic selenocysteine-containing dehydrogenase
MPTISTACPLNCYSTCSFNVVVEDNKIVNIEPNPTNKATPEGICLKGLSYIERANSKDRILFPLKKNSEGEFVRISWDEAFATISEKLSYFKLKYGSQSVLFYAASGMSGLLNDLSLNFWKLYGGVTRTYGNLCWPAGLEAVRLTLGEAKHNAPWDLVNSKLIILWGKNPAETNIHQTVFINEAQKNGAKLIVIDPRRTQSSENADYLYQIKPGTDAYLALTIAKILIKKEWYDKTFVDKYVLGFEQFAESIERYTPEKAEKITDIPVEFIYKLAEFIGSSDKMTIIPGYGMQRYTNGGQTIRSILALSVLTGNIGKTGACFHYANLQSYIFDEIKEPLSYYPSNEENDISRHTISTTRLGIDIQKTENPKIKMLWCERGNPVTQNPNTNTVLKAIRSLDFRVVVDEFMTDTAKEADIILPSKNMFEQSDIIGSYWNPYIQLKQKVVEPAGEVKPETEIYWNLAKKLGFSDDSIKNNLLEPTDEAIDNYLKSKLTDFPEIDWEKLKNGPQLAKNHEEIAFADMNFNTPSGKIELFSEQAKAIWNISELPEYKATKENENNSKFPYYFLSPNTKNRIHSQFGNLNIIKVFDPEPFVTINPVDAEKEKVSNNDFVIIFNSRGYIKVKTKLSFEIKPGCISVSNGWSISQGAGINFLSAPRLTDLGYGAAFHDNMVDIEKI